MVTGIDSFKEWFKGSEDQKGYFSGLYERTGKPSNNDGNYRNESIGFPIVQPLGKLYLNLNFRKK